MEKYIVKCNIMGLYDVVDENNKTIAGYNGLSLAEMIASKKNTEAENTRLKELNQEMIEILNWLVHLAHGVSKSGDRPGNDEWSGAWNQAMELLAKAEGG